MTDALLLKSGLRMPSSFVEVKDDEMEYVDGGIGIGAALAIVGICVAAAGISFEAGYKAGTMVKEKGGISWWVKLLLFAAYPEAFFQSGFNLALA